MSYISKLVAFFVGTENPSRSTIAIMWGGLTYPVANIIAWTYTYGHLFPDGQAPTYAHFATMFTTQFIASYVAAYLAPANVLKHAVFICVFIYIGSITGIISHWNDTTPWFYINQILICTVAAITSGWSEEVRRKFVNRENINDA